VSSAPPVVISTHYDGDYFGEASIIEISDPTKTYEDLNKKRSTAIAVEDCVLIRIDKQLAKKCFFSGDHDLSV